GHINRNILDQNNENTLWGIRFRPPPVIMFSCKLLINIDIPLIFRRNIGVNLRSLDHHRFFNTGFAEIKLTSGIILLDLLYNNMMNMDAY
ncbi:MAG: hypothetical protein JSW64_16115, partial [Candidatus Zixiibacteriota bacterium]